MIDPKEVQSHITRISESSVKSITVSCRSLFRYIEENVSAENDIYKALESDRKTKWSDWAPEGIGHSSWDFPETEAECRSLAWDLFKTVSESKDTINSLLHAMYLGPSGNDTKAKFLRDWGNFFTDAIASVIQADGFHEQEGREKQQKFGILDAPTLVIQDLASAPGILGRAFLYLDLDNFKSINTELTERVVDRDVLPPVHKLIKACVENIGLAYGEGGDEFTILLPNVSEGMAREFTLSFHQKLAALKLDGNASHLTLRASVGLAYETGDARLEDLPGKANLAKAAAKSNGKACTFLWKADGPVRL